MIDEKKILSFTFLTYGGEYSADHFGMRYVIKRTGEKPDFILLAAVWPEPYCFDKTPDETKITKEFEYSSEGRKEAINWIKEMYDMKRDMWDNAPRLVSTR